MPRCGIDGFDLGLGADHCNEFLLCIKAGILWTKHSYQFSKNSLHHYIYFRTQIMF